MPKDSELMPDFTGIVKDAFAGDANGASMAYDIAKDYYAGVMEKKELYLEITIKQYGSRLLT